MAGVIVLSSDDEDGGLSFSTNNGGLASCQSSIRFDVGSAADNFDDGMTPKPEQVDNDSFFPSPSSSRCSPESRGPLKITKRVVHDLSNSDSSDDELPHINLGSKNGMSEWVNDLFRIESTKNHSVIPVQRELPKSGALQSKPAKVLKRDELKMRKHMELEEKARQKEAVREERERKKKEIAHAKALKQASAEIERAKKPGECQKWVSTTLDPGLLTADYSGEMLTALRASELDYAVEDCIIPYSITWERQIHSVQVDKDMAVKKITTTQREPIVLIVWLWNEVIEKINSNTLLSTFEEMISMLPGNELTVVIYGIEDYFRFQKTQKNRDVRSEVLGTGPTKRKKKEATFDSAPRVSRGDVEFALAELQVKLNVSHRCINSKTDLANLVCQFTKAIAEAPFKREKNQKDSDRLDWYAVGDSKDCVTVDKDGNGSLQLWQRQLCQFPLASRETSEAIASLYPSPLSLMKAYDRCSMEDAQLLLQDIPVRRGPGPLSTMRRVGPQLSKKIYTFFTTVDEGCLIAPD